MRDKVGIEKYIKNFNKFYKDYCKRNKCLII